MNSNLERLIALQRLDSDAQAAQRRLAEQPGREKALEARLHEAAGVLDAAKATLAGNQTERRTLEKDLAAVQGRLSKFRDQLMEVKTNREYQAMQHEIATAQDEVRAIEGKLLERMIEADDLSAAVKQAETALASERKAVDDDRRALVAEARDLEASLARIASERLDTARTIDPNALAIFDLVASRRNGVAVAEARDCICTICHVRLRPQVFNTVLKNDQIVQCDTCGRILYSLRAPGQAAATEPAS
jgi:uncharacterized protein